MNHHFLTIFSLSPSVKSQASRTRSEADESFVKLEESAREKERIQREGEQELEKVKRIDILKYYAIDTI